MREILFRGQNPYTGEWNYGKLTELKKKNGHVEAGYYLSNEAGMPFAFPVSGKTLCQYTGLNDRNGKIFEGDIILWRHTESSGIPVEQITAVFFEEGAFYVKTIDNFYPSGFAPNGSLLYAQYRWFCEAMQEYPQGDFSFGVIGNIYDTPELLKNVG
jgi:uncharacterized phage protein (TIGR01671 family)